MSRDFKTCVIFGGTGYIGLRWAKRLAAQKSFQRIILADIRTPNSALPAQTEYISCDIRNPIKPQMPEVCPDWIFNFAAMHREPGHAKQEYFDTNLPGARNVCQFAEQTGCKNILFTSSIAVYGPTTGPTSENSPLYPITPYGISKMAAELIHEAWWRSHPEQRLYICRPGVVYGEGDPGNILRMIRAIKKGHFIFPGSKQLRKSYAYIEGLLDGFEFVMGRPEKQIVYNYVEQETEPLENLVKITQELLGRKNVPTLTAPLPLLLGAAEVMQVLTGGRSPIHPLRVRKAASSTHIVPLVLKNLGFKFNYDFRLSLQNWREKAPEDFS